MPLLLHEHQGVCQHLLKVDVHLREQADVDKARGDCRVQRDVAAVPTHELHHADAVRVRDRLHVRRLHGLERLGAGGVETEGLVHHRHVVVDRLRDADDRALVVDFEEAVEGLHGALVSAVATQHEVLLHVAILQDIGHVEVQRVPSVADQHGATLHVAVLDQLRGELQPIIRLHDTFEAASDTVDLAHTVGPEGVDHLANDRVQPGADASAAHHEGAGGGVAGVEV
mmetsp:Transcript_22311/g.76375  ORF Transcript_22311/g.76375 Transcript_22311/m.76375 type:complete len:227 (-) Transcript_22311:3889-4569(-)